MGNKIYIGADHAGYILKEKIKKWLVKKKISVVDVGAHKLIPTDDYPDYAAKVAANVARDNSVGILICGSAQGMCIAANKVHGVRAVVPFSPKEAQLSREHNDANVICLSGWYFNLQKAAKIVEKFLSTPFSQEKRHLRRINKIKKLELQSPCLLACL
ncbi:MAG: ribose 5-phosphate isomerase B [Nanoarchaeota archaeon]